MTMCVYSVLESNCMELLIIYMDFMDVYSHFFQGGNQLYEELVIFLHRSMNTVTD